MWYKTYKTNSILVPKIIAYVELTKPHIWPMAYALILAGYFLSNGFDPVKFGISLLIFGPLVHGSALVMNDIGDFEVDKINKNWRPLPSGMVSLKKAWIFAILLGMFGFLLTAYFKNLYFFIATLIFYVASASYSTIPMRIKARGFGDISVGIWYAAGMLAGATLFNALTSKAIWPMVIFTFLLAIGANMPHYISDYEGDRACNLGTIAVKMGPKRMAYINAVYSTLPFLLIPIFIKLGLFTSRGLYAMLILPFVVWISYRMIKKPIQRIGWENMWMMRIIGPLSPLILAITQSKLV